MKNSSTVRWLKISIILQIIFCSACLSSLASILIYQYTRIEVLLFLCILFMYGWMLNPTGWITMITGLILFFRERKDMERRAVIGMKWIWFVLFFIIDTVLYIVTSGMFVEITGGV